MSTTTAIKVIKTVEEFLATLKIGDKFWCMTSLYGKPTGIKGPFVIDAFGWRNATWPTPHQEDMVICTEFEDNEGRQEHYISGIANSVNHVFLNFRDAKAYFEERKLAWETDPKLIHQFHEAKRLAKIEDELIARSRF